MVKLVGILVGSIDLQVDNIKEDILYILYNNKLPLKEYPDNVIYMDSIDDVESILRANNSLISEEKVLISKHKDINEGIIIDIRRRIERIKNNLV